MSFRSHLAVAVLALAPGFAQAAVIGDSVDSGGFRFTLEDCGSGCALTTMTAAADGIGFDLDYANATTSSGSFDYTLTFGIEAIEGAGRSLSDLFSVTLGSVGTATGTGYINVTEQVVNAGLGTTFTNSIYAAAGPNASPSITKEYRSDLGISDAELESLTVLGFTKDHQLIAGDNGTATLSKVTQRFQLTPAPIPVPAALPMLGGGLALMSFVARRRKKKQA